MGLRSADVSKTYGKPYNIVFEEVQKALSDCGFKVEKANEESGEITAKSGISLASWGEKLTVEITKVDKDVRVQFHSGASYQLVDWGKSKRNADKFFAALDKKL